jgi:adenosine deaminase
MWFDLHRHLEGSHSPRALLEVARAFDIKNPLFFDGTAFRSPDELATQLTMQAPSDDASVFYQCIVRARAAYVSVEAIRALALAAFREAADDSDGFEMRLSLFSMARTLLENQGRAWREVPPVEFAKVAEQILRGVIDARDEAQRLAGKPMRLRLGLSRTFESEPHYRALADMVVDHARALVGLDVLGIVVGPDTEPLPPALVAILERLRVHLPDLTIHAGELADHTSVDRTLALKPRGIGHGVRSLQSPATLERLAREGVTLEVCPTSNRLLIPTAVRELEQQHGAMPLVALQRAHVHCVLGSDDPTPMGTSFSHEREVARASGVDMARLEADIARRWDEISASTRAR